MEFRILGPLEVRDGDRLVPLGGAKQRALLAILLLHPNQGLSSDRLIDLMWGDDAPGTAGNTLQVYVSNLRKALEPDRPAGAPSAVIVRRAPGYALQSDLERVDYVRFERLVDRALAIADDLPARSEMLGGALALWRGPALADFSYEPFAQADAARLEERRMEALEERIEADLALGRHGALVGELEAHVARHPLREGLRRQLMVALYRSGRQADALAVYADTRRVLDEELGIDPGAALQRLERQILRQDPALDAPVVTRPQASRAGAAPGRRVVTAVCCELDAEGLEQELDPEVQERVMRELQASAGAVLERHGAIVQVTPDDQVIGVFGVPTLHEDDAVRAARAATEIRDELSGVRLTDPVASIHAGLGMSTGEVVVTSSDLPRGDVLKSAGLLARSALPGEILLSDETRKHLASAAVVEEARAPVVRRGRVYALRGSVRAASDPGRRLNAPLVGRTHELARLTELYERVVTERGPRLLTLLGHAGVGKSRLLAEFMRALAGRAEVVTGRCPPYGEGVTFLPARDVVRQIACLEADASPERATRALEDFLEDTPDALSVAERLAEIAGFADIKGSPEELAWAVRRLLESAARRRPVVCVLDDVHWAEPALLDLVENVVEHTRSVPLLFVCAARPDFRDTRPTWSEADDADSALILEPLSEAECRALLSDLLGGEVAPEINARIVSAAEGNPLFVEEMARMLIDDGHLRAEDGRWIAVTDLSRVNVPPTIHALLAARLDRLEAGEREVLQHAGVVGRTFTRASLYELCDASVCERLPDHLTSLLRKELIRPDHTDEQKEEAYRFRHILIRDTAYAQMSKERRAELHERLAQRFERRNASPAIVAFHLERAYALRRELGQRDDEVIALADRAAARLLRAAVGAAAHGDVPTAVSMLTRARDLAHDDALGASIALAMADALADIGELERAEALLESIIRDDARGVDDVVGARARVQMWAIRSSLENTKGWRTEAWRDAREAMAVFERAGDDLGLAKCLHLQAMMHQYDYRFEASDAALRRALEHAARSGDESEETKVHYAYARSTLWGPTHVDDGLARYRDWLERFSGNRMVEANARRGMALLEAMRGNFLLAREHLNRTEELLTDLGLGLSATTSLVPGLVEMLAGDYVAAERAFRQSYDALLRAGERNVRATAAAYLARALYHQGRFDEAFELTVVSEELAPEDDFATMIEWAPTRAKVLARRGAGEEAERLSAESVRLASTTDELGARANTLMDRAEVLGLLERPDEVPGCVREALELYERKGDQPSAARARRVLELGAPAVIDLREEPARR